MSVAGAVHSVDACGLAGEQSTSQNESRVAGQPVACVLLHDAACVFEGGEVMTSMCRAFAFLPVAKG